MWIVKLALHRPYTFVVAAILVAILGIYAIKSMATDIFPNINIPVISVIYQYTGMSADEMEKRIVTPYERILTTTVNDIEHIESQSITGTGVVKLYFQPGVDIATANAQVTAVSQTALRQMPTGVQPPLILQYSASNVPIIQLSLSSETVPEQQMFDLATNVLRPKLITIPGIQVPYPYGGKQRQVMVDLDPERMWARNVSPADVSAAINAQNIIVPSGTAKIGAQEYQVRLNASPEQVALINDLPIKTISNDDGTKTTVFVKDVAHVRDGFQVQTNIVHSNGQRGVLISIYKNGGASTLDVVDEVKGMLPELQAALPPGAREGLKITPLFDQSVFVRASVEGVIHEAAIAAGLTGLMILLFLGSWRSTLIVVISIPLSILVSIIILKLLGETLNTMTLGGMALAVGILVDDATVTIENIHRNLHMRKRLVQAILDGAQEIAVPAFVATICICLVFTPVVLIPGAAKFLFTPLAMSVVFAMMTSYLLSRTLVPTLIHYLLAAEVEMYGGQLDPNDPHAHPEKKSHFALKLGLIIGAAVLASAMVLIGATPVGAMVPAVQQPIKSFFSENFGNGIDFLRNVVLIVLVVGVIWATVKYNLIWRVHFAFNRQFERLQHVYGRLLAWTLKHRAVFAPAFAVVALGSTALFWFVGKDFFPAVDAGQIRLHVRTPAGTRIEQTERYYAQVQEVVRRVIPDEEISVVLDNIGIPNSGINLSLSDGSVMAPSEGEVLVSLNEGHKPTEGYISQLRREIAKDLPDLVVWAAPADISTQVLNFGLPASIDVQIAGPLRNADQNRAIAMQIQDDLAKVPGVVDRRLQQVALTPDIRLNVDRTLAGQLGVTQRDVASDLLISLSSSNQTAPNFWLNNQNGVNYSIFVQTPQYRIENPNDLTNTPIVPTAGGGFSSQTQLLGNLATLSRGTSATNVTHYNINPTFDVLLSVQHLDLGRVAKQVKAVVDNYKDKLPIGSSIALRGQVQSMDNSFFWLGIGLAFAVVLVYLLMVVNFQSWTDPLIILMALPGAAAGILWMLWATHTPLSVPALMGALMSTGVATANSILLITFANDQRKAFNMNAHDAALSAGMTRLRPVIMTATAMIIGMLPMSLGLGDGGEQNAPLGRAVIGGLSLATVATLFFVPVVYSALRRHAIVTQVEKELE
ncbi:MAG: efflux RND transporter permease subunit [Tepidisphaeraceae bacterium]